MKDPSDSYTVIAVPALTACLKNPVAPLLAPLTKVGVDNVWAWFIEISTLVWTS